MRKGAGMIHPSSFIIDYTKNFQSVKPTLIPGQGLCKVSPPVIASRAAAKQSPHRNRGLLRRKDRSSQ